MPVAPVRLLDAAPHVGRGNIEESDERGGKLLLQDEVACLLHLPSKHLLGSGRLAPHVPIENVKVPVLIVKALLSTRAASEPEWFPPEHDKSYLPGGVLWR